MDSKEPAVEYQRDGAWLCVRCSGTGSAAQLAAILAGIGQAVAAEPAEAILIDMRELEVPLGMASRYQMGKTAAEHLSGLPVALVAAAAMVDPERFGELVARSRGVDGRVLTDIDEARAWLRSRVAERKAL